MKAKYECLLHTKVRSLSRGTVLCRFIELKNEVVTFFRNEGMDDFVKYLQNNDWYAKVAYLVDIFNYFVGVF